MQKLRLLEKKRKEKRRFSMTIILFAKLPYGANYGLAKLRRTAINA